MDSIEDMGQNTVALLPEQHQEIASASSIEDIDNSIGQGTVSLLPEQKPHEQHQELAAANIDASGKFVSMFSPMFAHLDVLCFLCVICLTRK
ncbi:predicted protein [Arabidopsis lyrata subsp. lyrata]|uniref:Predicted protein n=1 Tax=Arabidopsis lyrata subsp. lyrata TaxID=81972 RepID=D7KPV6_ARALL|nr:predicted protein [Arabidopsis lyrata subsp. lyrata]